MTERVAISRYGGLLELRLSRPDKLNALTGAMYDTLTRELVDGCKDDATGVFLLSAEGPAFSAGNDIGEFMGAGRDFAASPQAHFVRAIAACSKPIVAAVQGAAVGIGMTMLLHCDLVYASPDARLSAPFVSMGLVPEAGSSLLIPARLGLQRAAQLLLLGEPLDAAAAREAGLVSDIVPLDGLRDHARRQAARLAAQPPQALTATRALMRSGWASLDVHMTRELTAFGQAVGGPEAREAFTAFMEKRKPNFHPG